MIAGPEGTRSVLGGDGFHRSFSTVLSVIGNYKKLQQWIYEFCYQLGMHLKFRDRRRILNGPVLVTRCFIVSDKPVQCTPNRHRRPTRRLTSAAGVVTDCRLCRCSAGLAGLWR